jgi:protein-tyrosine phosphatase
MSLKIGVLFVCMGNICRSPTAEGVFRSRAERAGLTPYLFIDSAGTGDWHVGCPPDTRAIRFASARGYDLAPLRARQVSVDDFERFEWIFAMDYANLHELMALRPASYLGHLCLFLDLVPALGAREVPDPYSGRDNDFERVLDLVEAASDALVARIAADPRIRAAREAR